MRIVVGEGSCGLAAGAGSVYQALEKLLESGHPDNVVLDIAGCNGMCFLEPIVDLYRDDGELVRLVHVKENDAESIYKAVTENDISCIQKLIISQEDQSFLTGQTRIALRNCGLINPEKIDDYLARDGYKAISKILGSGMSYDDVIREIEISGLRGRGGAGFSTAFKWRAARNAEGEKKYLICNADEGDPGAFMDRAVIEGDPHNLIEGMLIAAYAIGASEGIVYVRAEYPLAIIRLKKAIRDALSRGYLGDHILGSDFSFMLRIKAGAGAFVCGEETALIESLEGKRGMPRLKPPYPAQSGYWSMPSNINNVETYANVPWILLNGGAAFAAMGTERSKGTKVFALTGKIRRGGLVEIPMGMTLREVIFGIGGGIRDGKEFKAVQLGGPSGGCIPKEKLDTVIDYDALASTGAIMGSGGMVVMDETTCMVGMARFFLDFTAKESCGKCVHCRIGTKRMLEILDRIVEGKGKEEDIDQLESLSIAIKDGSLCGLGQTAPNPVLTALEYFRNEFMEHILNHICPAGECRALITYSIDPQACIGCGACARQCPVHAITGNQRHPHTIDSSKCIKCGNCSAACRFGAVRVH